MQTALAILILSLVSQTPESYPTVGIIDFYGLRAVPEASVRHALDVREGDSVDVSHYYKWQKAETIRIQSVPGVRSAYVALVCCTDDHKSMLYVGVEEAATPCAAFEPAPDGSARLTDDIVLASKKVDDAIEESVLSGNPGEDDSQGHALATDSHARAAELALIPLAEEHLANLRDVLHNSSDELQRARAAQVLGYVKDKQSIVPDLIAATRDSSSLVRNNAMRALVVFTKYEPQTPAQKIEVPSQPFLSLLNSCIWTDRNKSAWAVAEFTESRDTALLAQIREQALPSLIEMARWKDLGHATTSLTILGRIGGLSDSEISKDVESGNREVIIAAAKKAAKKASGGGPK